MRREAAHDARRWRNAAATADPADLPLPPAPGPASVITGWQDWLASQGKAEAAPCASSLRAVPLRTKARPARARGREECLLPPLQQIPCSAIPDPTCASGRGRDPSMALPCSTPVLSPLPRPTFSARHFGVLPTIHQDRHGCRAAGADISPSGITAGLQRRSHRHGGRMFDHAWGVTSHEP
jgi:hypothetical protein